MARPFAQSTDVPTAGTRVQIQNTSDNVHSITFRGRVGNTGNVYVGDSTVAAAVGFELTPGDAVMYTFRLGSSAPISDFWVDAASSGDDVDWAVIFES